MAEVQTEDTLNHRSVRGRWDYIRQKLKRRGVMDVDKSHPHFSMLKCIRTGLKDLLLNHKELGPKDNLQTEDYHQVLSKTLKLENGKSFVFESYACSVFASLRRAVDISEADYLMSLVPPGLPYLEFISNSRSGQDFYFSNNQRFILKTDREHCVQYFQSILRDYIEHFHAYPHSLLVKFLGLHMIQISGSRKKYILVMQSAFYPQTRIQERFDLKGCFCGRYQKPSPPGKKTLLVLKDQNFIGEKIDLGPQKEWFLQQVKADVDFLYELGVGDYSMLVGRHPLHGSECRETLGNLVTRIQISSHDAVSTSHTYSSESIVLPEDHSADAVSIPGEVEMVLSPGRSSNPIQSNKNHAVTLTSLTSSSVLSSPAQNRRLLPNCLNNLHIIDGVNHRYYLGIIDFFTLFQCRQRFGKMFKDMKHCCKEHSTEPPDIYADRFYKFIAEITT
ncbi:hypothetical protein CHS0354_012865 [Potamilus streckersoni]|uniref:PIPK domain-containing protein n=1 Tax=Potamilus streckersoni TaxID=2493646 RepID=A0AAE0SWU9_9BIVA|nr:hypothetical protein CHS0354_012865 [Potamilus streckersoni]